MEKANTHATIADAISFGALHRGWGIRLRLWEAPELGLATMLAISLRQRSAPLLLGRLGAACSPLLPLVSKPQWAGYSTQQQSAAAELLPPSGPLVGLKVRETALAFAVGLRSWLAACCPTLCCHCSTMAISCMPPCRLLAVARLPRRRPSGHLALRTFLLPSTSILLLPVAGAGPGTGGGRQLLRRPAGVLRSRRDQSGAARPRRRAAPPAHGRRRRHLPLVALLRESMAGCSMGRQVAERAGPMVLCNCAVGVPVPAPERCPLRFARGRCRAATGAA